MTHIAHHDLPAIRERHRGQKIVFCSGTFDLTHAGHIRFFENCKTHGDILVVAVGNDALIRKLKGEKRPILPEALRLKTVASLKPVDYCFLGNTSPDEHPLKLLEIAFEKLKPDVYVVNSDAFDIPHRQSVAERFGVKVLVIPYAESYVITTTEIIERIQKLYQASD